MFVVTAQQSSPNGVCTLCVHRDWTLTDAVAIHVVPKADTYGLGYWLRVTDESCRYGFIQVVFASNIHVMTYRNTLIITHKHKMLKEHNLHCTLTLCTLYLLCYQLNG